MRYTTKQYAAAFLESIEGKPQSEQKRLVGRFLAVLSKKGDGKNLNAILREAEKQYLRRKRLKKVYVESVSGLSSAVRKNIEEVMGTNILLKERKNPKILAGIKILVDDDVLIDASAAAQLAKIFS